MIKWLHIHNLALIDDVDIDFSSGFNAVTGETGAGKSVLMSGIKLLLGERFEKDAIRAGTQRCEISGEFQAGEDLQSTVNDILDLAGVEPNMDGSLLIKRVFTPSGGRAFINASPVTAKVLCELGEILVDVHNANEAAGLMKPAEQLNALDRFIGNAEEKEKCRTIWESLKSARLDLEDFQTSMPTAAEAAMLKADLAAIDKVSPHDGEDAEMERTHEAAANSREILDTAQGAAAALTESDDSILNAVSQVRRMLQSIERADPEYIPKFVQRCEEIQDAVNRLSADVTDRAADVELDPAAFAELEERMTAVQTLKRKFGPELEDVLDYAEKARKKLDAFENSESVRNELQEKVVQAEKNVKNACMKLSVLRKKAAEKLSGMLKQEIIKLGFKRAEFSIEFAETPPGPNGMDKIEYMFSANPGVDAKPLRAVASSGELSRVMLAVKTVLADADQIDTLIFDEIDANIGGETAVIVAEELAALARKKQILSISHLAQVAAKADNHIEVVKITKEDSAVSNIRKIEGKERVGEIARMLGGGPAAEKHAAALLKQAGN